MQAGDWLRRGRAERPGAAGEAAAGAAGAGSGVATGRGLLRPGDGWSRAVAESGALDRAPGSRFEAFLALAADPHPATSKGWAATAELHVRAEKSALRKLRALLTALATAPPSVLPGTESADARPILVSRENTTAAVNTVAAAAHLLGEVAVRALGYVLCRLLEEPWTADSTSVRDTCAAALATVGTEAAFEQLRAAVPRAQTKAQREVLLLCMGRMPWSSKSPKVAGASFAELLVATHGLDAAGKRELTTHHRTYELTLSQDGSVRAQSLDDADVVANEAAERVLHSELRAISATYRKEVARLEALLATERTWPLATWRNLYLDHPITRAVASRLIWRVELEADSHARGSRGARATVSQTLDVIPAWSTPGFLRVVNASITDVREAHGIPMPEGVVSIQLWHPREAAPEDLAGWRAALRELRFEQPFQQIERDFAASPGNPEKTEFDRFAGEVTDAASWEAALETLLWTVATKSGGKTSDREDLIHREFPEDKVTATAMFTHLGSRASTHGSSAPADAVPDRIRLGSAWIHRTDDKSLTPLPLATLPARLCSEVERDLHVLTGQPRDDRDNPVRPAEVSDTLP